MRVGVSAVMLCAAVAVAAVAAMRVPPLSPTGRVGGEPPQVLPYGDWVGKRVLMVSAHPDDIEACAGGLVSLLTAQGTDVAFLIVTNGDKGCGALFCANWTSEQIAVTRAQEAVNAAAVMGVPAANVFLLDYEDGMVTSYPEQQIREDVVSVMRSYKPEVVMSWYPFPQFSLLPSAGWEDLGMHPDHQAVGGITVSAQFSSGVGRLFPTAGPGFHINEFYMWEFVQPTHYIDMSNATLQTKVNAYLQHKTQYPVAAEVQVIMQLLSNRVGALVGVAQAEGFRQYF